MSVFPCGGYWNDKWGGWMCQNGLATSRKQWWFIDDSGSLLSAEAAEELPGHLLAQDAGISLHEVYLGGESLLGGLLFQ